MDHLRLLEERGISRGKIDVGKRNCRELGNSAMLKAVLTIILEYVFNSVVAVFL